MSYKIQTRLQSRNAINTHIGTIRFCDKKIMGCLMIENKDY